MATILIDQDGEGYVVLLWGTLAKEGWLGLLPLEYATFADVGLPDNSSDRDVWRFAQANGMILLTNNRNMEGEDSLEQTLREENTPASLPVLTFGNVRRLNDSHYRQRCATQLVEIVLFLENHMGKGRVFIP
jgi:predicted nuclease of predicted toxin-antitoxin system